MDGNVLVTVISGLFSVASALGAVFLKDYLERRPARTSDISQGQPKPEPPPNAAVPDSTVPEPRTTAISWIRPASIIVGSFLFGIATRALRPLFTGGIHYESLGALIFLILACAGLATYHRRKGFQLPYQLEILALWAGWASGWSLIEGGVWSDLLGITIVWWLGCAFFGGLIVSVRNRARFVRDET